MWTRLNPEAAAKSMLYWHWTLFNPEADFDYYSWREFRHRIRNPHYFEQDSSQVRASQTENWSHHFELLVYSTIISSFEDSTIDLLLQN